MNAIGCTSILWVAVLAGGANAYEFRVRFVERTGTTDTTIDGNLISIADGLPHRIRLQAGVFDDAASLAPAGGLLGWNVGTITVADSATDYSHETRTPGRLAPWNFAQGPNSNGNPPVAGGDPFDVLTEIDATQGTQSPPWPSGERPPAVIRGRNTFVSLYEITITAAQKFGVYGIDFGGNLLAASEWIVVTESAPDPDKGTPGTVVYAPFPTDPRAFLATLKIRYIPAPGAAIVVGLSGLAAIRRRR